jgi:hypothetical protein
MVQEEQRTVLNNIGQVADFFAQTDWGVMLPFANELLESLKHCAEFNRKFGHLKFDDQYPERRKQKIEETIYNCLLNYSMGMATEVASRLGSRGQGICAECRRIFGLAKLKVATSIDFYDKPDCLLKYGITKVIPLCPSCYPDSFSGYRIKPKRERGTLRWYRPIGPKGPLDIHIPIYGDKEFLPLPPYTHSFIPRPHQARELESWEVESIRVIHSACGVMLAGIHFLSHVCLDDDSGHEIHANLGSLK